MNRPDYLLDIPAAEYHQATKDGRFLSSHRLAIFRRCPAEYRKVVDGVIVQGETEAFALGRATHSLVLEGEEAFRAEFVVADGPLNEKTGRPFGRETAKYKEWAAAQTKAVVSSADYANIEKMREAVRGHEAARALLSRGVAEATVRTEFDGVPVQVRLDWFDPERGILADLKTCQDVDRFRFDIRDFGYVEQLAFYAHALELGGFGRVPDCYLVAVEKREPFRVCVVNACALTLDAAINSHPCGEGVRDDIDEMIRQFKACGSSGVWPTRYEHVVTI